MKYTVNFYASDMSVMLAFRYEARNEAFAHASRGVELNNKRRPILATVIEDSLSEPSVVFWNAKAIVQAADSAVATFRKEHPMSEKDLQLEVLRGRTKGPQAVFELRSRDGNLLVREDLAAALQVARSNPDNFRLWYVRPDQTKRLLHHEVGV